MKYLVLFSTMVTLFYIIQLLTSLLVYCMQMKRLEEFRIVYQNINYFKYSIFLLTLLFLIFLIFRFSTYSLIYPFIAFYSYRYLNLFYRNTIMETDEFMYNGVAVFRKQNVKNVFIENGSNLEKKYNTKYNGFEKYKRSDYLIFEFVSNSYVLIKGFDIYYLDVIRKNFTLIE